MTLLSTRRVVPAGSLRRVGTTARYTAGRMERSRRAFEAQACLGCRVIFRSACRHRLPCPGRHSFAGRFVHSEGLLFRDEPAAQRFDLSRPARDACGQAWHTFPSWDAAERWLRAGCLEPAESPP